MLKAGLKESIRVFSAPEKSIRLSVSATISTFQNKQGNADVLCANPPICVPLCSVSTGVIVPSAVDMFHPAVRSIWAIPNLALHPDFIYSPSIQYRRNQSLLQCHRISYPPQLSELSNLRSERPRC